MTVSIEERNKIANESAVDAYAEILAKKLRDAQNRREGTDKAIEQHNIKMRIDLGYQKHNGAWIYPDQQLVSVDKLPKYVLRDELERLRSLPDLTQPDKARCFDLMVRIESIDTEELDQCQVLSQLIG